MTEKSFRGHLNLRGNPDDPAFRKAVQGVLGLELPCVPNTVIDDGELVAYWLGPDEWLIVSPGDREHSLEQALRVALADLFAAVTAISGGQTVIVLQGKHARDVLAGCCTLDLHPRVFGPGRCAQSLLGKAPILIRQVDDSPRFELIVRRSFADYLWLWLNDSANVLGEKHV
ncbi:MAG: sarcosine oxidase subunit gamma [Candidatus Competibacteraceae bacterium]|nr:sarcosine oxidase subunit gamma [Candidatus Competibacteraceae bacterium]MCB1810630.1 sarcosine oxidase subunit gamma [Candidatus Competibacteraceae bacterium]